MGRKKRDEAHLLETIGNLKEEIQVLKAEFWKTPAQPQEGNWDELRPRNTRNPRGQGRGNGRGAFQRRNNSAPSYACWACGQTGHFAYQCTNVNTKGKCFLCYKEGHLAKDCSSQSVNLALIGDLPEVDNAFVKEKPVISRLYDIGKDILNTRANITFAQLMQYDDQKARASRILDPDRKPKMVANLDEYEKEIEHTPAKVYTRIKGNAILAIIDSGAGTSVITKPLAVALGLRWKLTNQRDMVTIDGQKQGIVGELDEVDVCIADVRTTIKMYMVGSTTKTLLLENNKV